MEENIDTGDILRSVEYDINLEDTIVDIKDKNVKIAINNLKDIIDAFLKDRINPIRQIEGNYKYYRRKPEDGLIDWSNSALKFIIK